MEDDQGPPDESEHAILELTDREKEDLHWHNRKHQVDLYKDELIEKIARLRQVLRMTDAQVDKRVEDVYALLCDPDREHTINYRWLTDMNLEMTDIIKLYTTQIDYFDHQMSNLQKDIHVCQVSLKNHEQSEKRAGLQLRKSQEELNNAQVWAVVYMHRAGVTADDFKKHHAMPTSTMLKPYASNIAHEYDKIVAAEAKVKRHEEELLVKAGHTRKERQNIADFEDMHAKLQYTKDHKQMTLRRAYENVEMIEEDVEELSEDIPVGGGDSGWI